MISDLVIRIRALFRRITVENELDAELRFHFEKQVEKFAQSGLSLAEARRRARLTIGGAEQIKEQCREARGVHFLETLAQDITYAIRSLRKSPGVTIIVVIALALGAGANTAIFSIVNGFLLRPLPVRAPNEITVLAIQQKDAPLGSSGFSYPAFNDFRKQADAFSDIFGLVLSSVQLTSEGRSEQCFTNYVSGNFFSVLGINPAAGRLLLPAESETPRAPLLAVLDYSYWHRRFNADPNVIGRQVRFNGKSATIVGIAPRNFHGMFSIFETDVYLPMTAISLEEPDNLFWNSRDPGRILAFGRLKPQFNLKDAQTSIDLVVARLAEQYPATDRWITVRAIPEKSARPIPYANNSFVAVSTVFQVLAAFVLLLACMNVENILLARGAAREREMGIRAALGAGRSRLVGQMLAESILLAILGGTAGILLAVFANHSMNSIHFQNVPVQLTAAIDWRVFTFAASSVLFTGIAVGLVPALRASSAKVSSVFHVGTQRQSTGLVRPGFRNFLVVAQVAGSLVLLVAAGLFVRSLQRVKSFDLGFDPDHVLNVTVDPHEIGYTDAQTIAFYRDVEGKARVLPGVQSASLATYVPMGGYPSKAPISIDGQPLPPGQPLPSVLFNCVDPPYFDTMRIALLRGRSFTDSDNESAPPVAIINQTMSNRFWPHEDPIGKRFSIDGDPRPFFEIVGVTTAGKYHTLGEDPQSFFYVPLAQNFSAKRILQIRTQVPPESLASSVKDLIDAAAPGLSIMGSETMKQSLDGALGFLVFRLAAKLAGILGMIGVILAVVGVYGVVSFAASQRTREIGIRMALGANSRDILILVWFQGVRLVLSGIVIGIAAAWALSRSMAHLLAGISPSDPLTYATVALLLASVALLACSMPAWQAMRVDPMTALRYE